MSDRTFDNIPDALRAMKRDFKARERRLQAAVKKAARLTANHVIRETVPKAFGELQDSIHVVDEARGTSTVVADAPHAEAVEKGSRPHTPPLEPLVRWVVLRGFQGLSRSGRVRSNRIKKTGQIRDWRKEAAKRVATELRAAVGGKSKHAAALRGRLSDSLSTLAHKGTMLNAPPEAVDIARRIQAAISKRGTKPFRFMAQAVPFALAALDRFVNEAMPEKDSGE